MTSSVRNGSADSEAVFRRKMWRINECFNNARPWGLNVDTGDKVYFPPKEKAITADPERLRGKLLKILFSRGGNSDLILLNGS